MNVIRHIKPRSSTSHPGPPHSRFLSPRPPHHFERILSTRISSHSAGRNQLRGSHQPPQLPQAPGFHIHGLSPGIQYPRSAPRITCTRSQCQYYYIRPITMGKLRRTQRRRAWNRCGSIPNLPLFTRCDRVAGLSSMWFRRWTHNPTKIISSAFFQSHPIFSSYSRRS